MWRYIDKLPDFVKTLNDRVNRSIGMAPSKVEKKHVLKLIALKQRSAVMKEKKAKYKVGDLVRIASKNVPFRKGYLQQFTNEIFQFPQYSPLTLLHFARWKRPRISGQILRS